MPTPVRAVGRDSIVPGIPDVAFVTLDLRLGHRRQRRAELARAEQAAPHRVVGSEKMVVYDDGAAEPVRVFDHGVVYKDPETFGEYQLSYRTGDILSPKLDTYEPLPEELATSSGRSATARDTVASAALAQRRRPPHRGRRRSLREGGAEVEIDEAPSEAIFLRSTAPPAGG